MNLILLAQCIAEEAHRGQHRRDGVTPYIRHPARVANQLRITGESDEVIAAGWLHDVIEDTKVTADDMRHQLVPESVVQAVVLMSKNTSPGLTYAEYIRSLRANPIAKRVKVADIIDNLSDNPTNRQIEKYAKALQILMGKDETPPYNYQAPQ